MLHRRQEPHDPLSGKWVVPGGQFAPGESPEDCVWRMVREETGLSLLAFRLRGIVTFVTPTSDRLETYTGFLFESRSFGGALEPGAEDDLRWIDDLLVYALDTPPSDRIFLPWIYEDNRMFSAKFILHPEHRLDSVSFY